jgi:coproporphyrinogen III oxidase-like Fe-S oxidoreductase
MYKNVKFEPRPFDEIASDISAIRKISQGSQTIFIGDSDSLLHKEILKVVKLISETFPGIERMTSYARALTLVHKDIKELRALKKAGLTRVHVGLESGYENILKSIRKGATPEIMIKGGIKAKEAGFEFCFYVLCGIGGETLWQEHADGTARVINSVNPNFIRLRTLSLVPKAPLFETWESGRFELITPLTRLKETRRLIKKLNVSGCELASDHLTNYLWAPEGIIFQGVNGKLPQDKEMMLDTLEKVIKKVKAKENILDANTLVQRGFIERL